MFNGYFGSCNAAQLPDGSNVDFVDLEKTLTIKPHGAGFLFVALSDQSELGCAQTHMLRRGHIALEEFFNWQLEQFGSIGPPLSSGSEGWTLPGDRHFRRGPSTEIPTVVKRYFARAAGESSVIAEEGDRVPRATPLLLRPGDAAISTFHQPHCGSPNDRGADRQQMISRFIPDVLENIKCGNPNTDPQWAPRHDGSWFPVSPDECSDWRAHLTDCWHGWAGMREVATRERPKTERARAEMRRFFRAQWAENAA